MSHNNFILRALRLVPAAAICAGMFAALALSTRAASDESDVRGTVEQAFQQLRAGNYEALYDVLPSASRQRLTRQRFVQALQQTRNMYDLDRMEIDAVHVAGDLAVVDSTIYGRGRAPFAGEGKLVVRQYLVREDGRWRVTTGSRAAISPLLAANPSFAKLYPAKQPRLYIKREGRWVDMSAAIRSARRQAK